MAPPQPDHQLDYDVVRRAVTKKKNNGADWLIIRRKVNRVAARILGSQSPDLRDVEQMAAYRIYRGFRGLAPSETAGSVSGWVAEIARNLAIDVLRANARYRRVFTDEVAVEDERAQEHYSTSSPVEASEQKHLLAEALGVIAYEYRVAFVLRHFEDLDDATIAEKLGVSQVTVRTRVHRAVGMMRDYIHSKYASEVPAAARAQHKRFA
jgi:RNA polymerase sigma-70 factor (ECF subfamily)